MFDALRRIFSNSVSSDYIGQSLAELLLGKGHDNIVEMLSNKMGLPENEIALVLASLYLFSYKIVIKRNALNLSSSVLDNIYYSLKYHLVHNSVNRYNLKQAETLVAGRVCSEVEKYLTIYNNQQKTDFKEIITFVHKSLLGVERNLEISMYLLELLYRNITIIQDYLIDLSMKEMTINNYKNKKNKMR